ncbi:MAG: RNA polymerase sigma factor [Candidatus Omnitrophica bacterium]|nr:RNA polymerase sigma factor [Candidatus Omnitrophota bacterium]
MEEASVITLVRAGNADAFADIIEHYQAPIQRYLYRMTGDYELARDLAQDTFIQAYKGILKTDSELSFRAWLYRIATNNALQFHRRRRLVSFVPFSTMKKTEIPAGDCIEETSQNMAIEEALHEVPKDQRVCMMLHFVEGFKYWEIAETLGITEEAVRKRVARGSQEFRRRYSSGGGAR